MQSIKHIIWDWNGTLLDDTQACVNSVNKMLSDRNLPLLTIERYRDIFGFPVSEFYREIGFVLENEDWDAMAVQFHDLFLADSSTRLHDAARYTLETCNCRGISQSVLSASKQSILDEMLCEYDLKYLFAFIRGISNLYGDSKMTMGRKLVEEIGVPRDEIIIIGDSLHDYEVAADLNIACVLIAGGHQSYERLATAGVQVLPSLDDAAALLL